MVAVNPEDQKRIPVYGIPLKGWWHGLWLLGIIYSLSIYSQQGDQTLTSVSFSPLHSCWIHMWITSFVTCYTSLWIRAHIPKPLSAEVFIARVLFLFLCSDPSKEGHTWSICVQPTQTSTNHEFQTKTVQGFRESSRLQEARIRSIWATRVGAN